jgi:hypothetical protein
MLMSIRPILSNLSKAVILLIAGFITAGCASLVTVTSSGGNPRFDVIQISVKGTYNGNNTYKFKEEMKYTVDADIADKGLSVVKTICVDKDCKAAKKHKIGSINDDVIKTSFLVPRTMVDKKFTMTTDVLVKDSIIGTYTYVFYPKECLEEACKDYLFSCTGSLVGCLAGALGVR